jgi:hypothetical protein
MTKAQLARKALLEKKKDQLRKARAAREAEKAEKAAAAAKLIERPKLSVNPKARDAWVTFIAERDREDAAKIAAATLQRKPGREGNRLSLVAEQASDANIATKTVRNLANDPVEWLFNRGSLTQRQYEGASRIRADAEGMTIGSMKAVDIGGAGGGGGSPGSLSDHQLDCIRRFKLCMSALGRVGGELVRCVVVECRPLKDVGEKLGMDKNYRAPRLAEALDVVADFYRL